LTADYQKQGATRGASNPSCILSLLEPLFRRKN